MREESSCSRADDEAGPLFRRCLKSGGRQAASSARLAFQLSWEVLWEGNNPARTEVVWVERVSP